MQSSRARVTTISFDGDGTLWDFEKVMRLSLSHALAELRRLNPVTPDTLTIEKMITVRNQTAERLKGEVTNLEAVRLAAFQRTLLHVGITDDELAAHLNAVYLRHRWEDIELFDDVLPTLDSLQGEFQLGLISNGNSYPERCGPEGRFQFVVFSQDYGVEKPNPRLFEIAMKQAGCTASQLVHVGDSLENDAAGARRAGAWSVWLNREAHRNHTDVAPDFEVSALTELDRLLNGMR